MKTIPNLSQITSGLTVNHNLQRYDGQIRMLMSVVPLLIVLMEGLIYTLTTRTLFNWLNIFLFLVGWWIGLWLAVPLREKRWKLVVWLLIVAGVLAILILWHMGWISIILKSLELYHIFGQAFFTASIVVFMVTGALVGVLFGMEADVTTGGVAVGIAVGVVGSVSSSATIGVLGGAISGAVGGLIGGTAFGVTRGVLGGYSRGVVGGITVAVAIATAVAITQSMIVGVMYGEKVGFAVGIVFGIAFGIAFGAARGMVGGVVDTVVDVVVGLAAGLLGGVAIGLAGSVTFGTSFGEAFGMAACIAWMLGALRFYFWLPECLWMFILYLRSRHGHSSQLLHYIAPYFDELIIIPLPFTRELIVKAYQEDQTIARQTLDYLITSTNQQKVAVQVTTSIVIEALNRCKTTRDIAAIINQLDEIPSPLPKGIGRMLPQFLEVSQGVKAATEASSFYRQHQELQKPILALQKLRGGLVLANTWEATTFGGIAVRWFTVLNKARSDLEEKARQSKEIPQVYIPGPALDPDRAGKCFKGRLDLFREIETLLISDQPLVLLLHGGRRTGKTSVLKYLPQRVGPDIVPIFVDIQRTALASTPSGLANQLAIQIVEAARLSRNLRLSLPDAGTMDKDPFLSLLNWLGQIENEVEGKRFLLCLDEFERLSQVIELMKSRAPLDFLRHVMQHNHRWLLLFSGSHTLGELAPYWSDYLINTRALPVSYLEEHEARELILHPVEGFPDIYDEDTVVSIIRLTHCQPYLLQLLCYILVDHLNKQQRQYVLSQDLETIIPRILSEGEMYFREFWFQNLQEKDRNLLIRLVRGKMPEENEQSIVEDLVKKEILEKIGAGYQLQVPLVRIFI